MSEINFYYLEKPTLSNLGRIFSSADIPFIRLSKFLSKEDVNLGRELTSEEKIGFFKRKIGPAYLGTFGNLKIFIIF